MIKLFPSSEQKRTLNKWFGTARWTYNQCVATYLEKSKADREACLVSAGAGEKQGQEKSEPITASLLRSLHVNAACFKKGMPHGSDDWVLKCPYEVRDGGMRDAMQAQKSNWAKFKKDPSHKWTLQFKGRKDKSQSIQIRQRVIVNLTRPWTSRNIRAKNAGKVKKPRKVTKREFNKETTLLRYMRSSEPIPRGHPYDFRLVKNNTGYWLAVPKPRAIAAKVPQYNNKTHGVVSLDPGVRTFQTCFDGDGNVLHWGEQDVNRLIRLSRHVDRRMKLASTRPMTSDEFVKLARISNPGKRDVWVGKRVLCRKRRAGYRRSAQRVRNKIANLMKDSHRRLAKFLCQTYKTVIIPEFNVSQMVKSFQKKRGVMKRRPLRKVTVRGMLALGHYKFRQTLEHKAREYSTKVIVVNEAYTSKTCGVCGCLNETLGGKKTFKCSEPGCNAVLDRDVNGARNIFLKNLCRLSSEESEFTPPFGGLGLYPADTSGYGCTTSSSQRGRNTADTA